mmetsp:Transcript_11568/g.28052  ORF Transcript_11568/g.28052 Transcript_11568/m.28052 type:complete len:313 (-) Transcript_11568:187-1125(-)
MQQVFDLLRQDRVLFQQGARRLDPFLCHLVQPQRLRVSLARDPALVLGIFVPSVGQACHGLGLLGLAHCNFLLHPLLQLILPPAVKLLLIRLSHELHEPLNSLVPDLGRHPVDGKPLEHARHRGFDLLDELPTLLPLLVRAVPDLEQHRHRVEVVGGRHPLQALSAGLPHQALVVVNQVHHHVAHDLVADPGNRCNGLDSKLPALGAARVPKLSVGVVCNLHQALNHLLVTLSDRMQELHGSLSHAHVPIREAPHADIHRPDRQLRLWLHLLILVLRVLCGSLFRLAYVTQHAQRLESRTASDRLGSVGRRL